MQRLRAQSSPQPAELLRHRRCIACRCGSVAASSQVGHRRLCTHAWADPRRCMRHGAQPAQAPHRVVRPLLRHTTPSAWQGQWLQRPPAAAAARPLQRRSAQRRRKSLRRAVLSAATDERRSSTASTGDSRQRRGHAADPDHRCWELPINCSRCVSPRVTSEAQTHLCGASKWTVRLAAKCAG